jgi:hypothetical protein
MLEAKPEVKWYLKTPFLVTAFLCVGPFALPLFWLNPRFSQKTKIILSVIVIILSYWLGIMLLDSFKALGKYYQELNQLIL